MNTETTLETRLRRLGTLLRSPVTVTLPGWAIAGGAAAFGVLVLLALD